jgi:hypothetical protein
MAVQFEESKFNEPGNVALAVRVRSWLLVGFWLWALDSGSVLHARVDPKSIRTEKENAARIDDTTRPNAVPA